MSKQCVTVYAFERGSIITGGNVRSRRLATREAIAHFRCVPVAGSERLIPVSDLDGNEMTAIDYAG